VPGWLGPWEIVIFVFVVLLLFFPKRIPAIGRRIGDGVRELRSAVQKREDKLDAQSRVREHDQLEPRA
jgi:sec-independent protein translocase protein TatA